jgi:hypothetical protein
MMPVSIKVALKLNIIDYITKIVKHLIHYGYSSDYYLLMTSCKI